MCAPSHRAAPRPHSWGSEVRQEWFSASAIPTPTSQTSKNSLKREFQLPRDQLWEEAQNVGPSEELVMVKGEVDGVEFNIRQTWYIEPPVHAPNILFSINSDIKQFILIQLSSQFTLFKYLLSPSTPLPTSIWDLQSHSASGSWTLFQL